ncbi:zinc finger protein CONSTANS-LIKE 4 [Ricinus communis]|uniref:Transcription factor, putative n=1 Tax=Ricinus communis TaxID=3988 RepID=B9SIH7_RICCO|nr:zinc finger protein CONSTANS-LIKE 4 [Ricinus communis]EEF36632.1 transcription factor, putative [Ricinus communis]|eukprot:XP_002525796.1 zinc finger protein CONSTANS-LIKE 4 [Ricinus communis]
MKGCELCGGAARMYCESDQASLCWSCDEKVHSANFLVAKHCRNLLCQVCQSPTPWKASGPKLGPTVSICDSCFSLHNSSNNHRDIIDDDGNVEESLEGNDHDDEFDSDDDLYDDDVDEEEEEEEEDGDNQVVPWSVTPPSPPSASSSDSEEEISSRLLGGAKRVRESIAYLDSDDEIGCSSSQMDSGRISGNDEGNSLESFRKLKQRRRIRTEEEEEEDDHHDGQAESRSTAVIDSLKRLQNEMVTNRDNASATILGICRLSRDHHNR